MDLIVVIPSRGRPGQAAALVDAIADTAEANTFCVVSVDSDDPTVDGYESAMRGRARAIVHIAEPAGHVGAINNGIGRAFVLAPDVLAFAKLDDDHMPRTRGWDRILLEELDAIGGGIVYGDDLYQHEALPTAPVVSARIVTALGWFAHPGLRHMFCDDVWRELGLAAGCLKYVPRVHIEHRHPLAGKAQWDETYLLSNVEERYAEDGAVYRQWLGEGLAADAEKVRAVLGKANAAVAV